MVNLPICQFTSLPSSTPGLLLNDLRVRFPGKVKSLLLCTFFKWCKLLQLDLQYNASHFAKRFCQALAVHPLLITFCLYHFANFIVFLIFILLTQYSKVKHSSKIAYLVTLYIDRLNKSPYPGL